LVSIFPDDDHSLAAAPGFHGGTPGGVQGVSIQAEHVSDPLPEALAEQPENFSSSFDSPSQAMDGSW